MHHHDNKDNKHSLSLWNWDIIRLIIEFFFPPKKPTAGTILVSGQGCSEFSFKSCPEHVFVYFEDECEPIPCNPGTDDLLDWKIVEYDCHCTLIIEWDVASTRKIAWRTC